MAKPGPKIRTQLEDVIEVFTARDDRAEPLTAPEVADALGCSRRTALDKLHALGEDGRLRSKKVGGRSRVWWEPIEDSRTTQTTLSHGTDG